MPMKKSMKARVFLKEKKTFPKFLIVIQKGKKKIPLKSFTTRSSAIRKLAKLKSTGLVR